MTRTPGDRAPCYATENAIPDWDGAETYETGDIVRVQDGSVYVATDEPRDFQGRRRGWRRGWRRLNGPARFGIRR